MSLGVVACSGSDGAAGPAGAAGASGAAGPAGPAGAGIPSAGAVVPNVGLLDRELDVTVTAQSVDFTAAAPTLDFGAGVTASKLQVLSPTTLVVHLAVDVAAKTGTRDVKITEGATSVTSKGGFTVAAPIDVTVTPKAPQQGGIAFIDLTNRDLNNAFDSTADSGGTLFGGPITFPNIVVVVQDGLSITGVTAATATSASAGFLLDPTAAATTNVIAANIDASGSPVETYAGDPVAITPRAPTAATVGTPLTAQNIAAAGGTNLYKFSTNAVSILEVLPAATGGVISPVVFVYGDSGKNVDLKAAAGSVIYPTPAAAHTAYATVLDSNTGGGTAADYGYTFSVIAHTGTLVAEAAAAHATLLTAQAATALPIATSNNGDVVTGALAAGTEEDWYKVTLAAGENLEVALDGDFDATVDLLDAASASLLANGPVSSSAGSRVASVTTDGDAGGTPLVAGTYYIHVTSADGTAKGNYLFSLRKR